MSLSKKEKVLLDYCLRVGMGIAKRQVMQTDAPIDRKFKEWVEENIQPAKKSGFEKSLEGEQTWPPKLVRLNPQYEEAEYDVKLDPANTIHVGPPPKNVDLTKCWNGEETNK